MGKKILKLPIGEHKLLPFRETCNVNQVRYRHPNSVETEVKSLGMEEVLW
jgi:hypothetical protein